MSPDEAVGHVAAGVHRDGLLGVTGVHAVGERDDERALLMVAETYRRLMPRRMNIDRMLVAIVAGLHLLGALTMLFAPDAQLLTQGTRPVFALLPPPLWAVLFTVGGFAALVLLWRVTGPTQVAAWMTVLPTQTVWLGASFLAVARGGGSAMGVVFLSAVLAFTIVTALATAVDFTTGKR